MPEHAYSVGVMPRGASAARRKQRGAGGALLLAALCAVALALVWAIAAFVPAAHVRDAVALHDFTLLDGSHIAAATKSLLHLLDPLLFTIWGLALVLIALARRRPRVALAVVVVMALAPLSSEVLKPLLAHPHARVGVPHVGPASWPRGHATAAAALALCAVLVAPARRRPLVALLGVAFTLTVGVALLIGAWHMPSDVLGGYLMAVLWMALAVAGLRASERRWPSRGALTRVAQRGVAPS
jgi:membrane-associated phospholipid phosphatase